MPCTRSLIHHCVPAAPEESSVPKASETEFVPPALSIRESWYVSEPVGVWLIFGFYAVVDLKLNGEASGLACVQMLHRHNPKMLIVVLTGFASIATAVEAIKLGACHYLAKPSNTDDIEAAFGRATGTTEVELTNRSTSIKTLEWERIHETLAETGFNISETARRLGMHRRTLARKLGKQQVK